MIQKEIPSSYTSLQRSNNNLMNPMTMMKLMSAKAAFEKTHPKFVAFLNNAMARSMEEGTIIELTMTRPGETPITTNIKVQKSDLELVESLRNLAKTEK